MLNAPAFDLLRLNGPKKYKPSKRCNKHFPFYIKDSPPHQSDSEH